MKPSNGMDSPTVDRVCKMEAQLIDCPVHVADEFIETGSDHAVNVTPRVAELSS